MVFNQKPRKPKMFIANFSKMHNVFINLQKKSICYNLLLNVHDKDLFHHPKILKLASDPTHIVVDFNQDKTR